MDDEGSLGAGSELTVNLASPSLYSLVTLGSSPAALSGGNRCLQTVEGRDGAVVIVRNMLCGEWRSLGMMGWCRVGMMVWGWRLKW